jgi:hypothetical protein
MTLENTVREKLSEWRPAAGRQELTIPFEGGSLSLMADRREDLGCLVWEVALRRTAPAKETLRAWADRIAARVTGLLEPLKVIEIDKQRHEGLLRSETPLVRGDKVLYCEIMLKGTNRATLRRYEAPATGMGHREQVAFALTHDALAKLAGDLTAGK